MAYTTGKQVFRKYYSPLEDENGIIESQLVWKQIKYLFELSKIFQYLFKTVRLYKKNYVSYRQKMYREFFLI